MIVTSVRDNMMRLVLGMMILVSTSLGAQTASLRGQVTDESGAVIPAATVTLKGPAGLMKTAVTGSDGSYSFTGLPSGDYTVQALAPDLVLPKPVEVRLRSGVQIVNLQLK